MSKQSRPGELGSPRALRGPEFELVSKLLLTAEDTASLKLLPHLLVQELLDGEMGSLYFCSERMSREERHMLRCIAQIGFTDTDGVEVLASLDVDQHSDLYELDVWKVDFSPTARLTEP